MGWIYVENENLVNQAQEELDAFNRQQQAEAEKEAIQKEIDAIQGKIDKLEDEKKAWQDLVDEMNDQLDRAEIELENNATIEEIIFGEKEQTMENYKTAYIAAINEMIAALKALAEAEAAANAAGSAGENHLVGESKPVKPNTDRPSHVGGVTGGAMGKPSGSIGGAIIGGFKPSKKAKGSNFIQSQSLYNIDEQGDEMIIPPRGRIVSLPVGTGVIPNNLTQNLMEIGRYSMSQLLSLFDRKSKSLLGSNNIDNSQNINIDSVTVHSDNARDFVRQLQNLALTTK